MRAIFVLFFASLLTACMSTQPMNDLGFGEVKKISDLDGCYLNLAIHFIIPMGRAPVNTVR